MPAASNVPAWCVGDVARRAWSVGAEIAGPHADSVDAEARFPVEAVDAMRERGLFASMVPIGLGGEGAPLRDVAMATRALASHCAASALVFAMHQIEICYLNGHGNTDCLRNLSRRVVADGLLLANANSEVGLGGDVGRSFCAIEREGGRVRLTKDVLAMSYGAYADAVLVTARAHPDAPETDQVMLACGPGSFTATAKGTWDTTGLRGTCSPGFLLLVEENEEMVLTDSWATIMTHTVGATTILLNSVWLGIAEAAASKAHAYVRAAARRQIGTTPSSAAPLAELAVTLGEARAVMASCVARYEDAMESDGLAEPALIVALRNLKLSSTELAIEVVMKALRICGLEGYRRQSPYSLDRQVRDVLGGPLMANNARFYAENAQLLLVLKNL